MTGTPDAQVDDHNRSICTDMCGGAREYYSLFAVHAKALHTVIGDWRNVDFVSL